MKKSKKRVGFGLGILLLLAGIFGSIPATAYAEEDGSNPVVQKYLFESELFATTAQGDLTISAEYDGAIPEVTFLSPSGKEYSEFVSTEEEFRYAHGSEGGWSTFLIKNAEAGMWSVRCYKTDEEPIEFFLARVEEGICIQEFSVVSLIGKEATVSFDVTKGEQQVSYTYSIGVIAADGTVIKEQVVSGYGTTGTAQQITFTMDVSDCKHAKFLLTVECDDAASTFDSMESVEFSYENPDAPDPLAGVDAVIDESNLKCTLDWEQYRPWGWGSYTYNVTVYADGDTETPIFSGEDMDDTATYFYYPKGTNHLEIVITYASDGILSKEYRKQISLSAMDYIRVTVEDVTEDVMLPLEYSAKEEAELLVTLNGQSGAYRIKGRDRIYFSLEEGINQFYATFTGADGVTHTIDKEIYCVVISPEITLYEDLDGKMFRSSTVHVTGRTENAVSVTINEEEVTLEADGTFSYDVPLAVGENEIAVKAVSESGAGTAKIFTVTREGEGEEASVPGIAEDGEEPSEDEEDGEEDGTDTEDIPASAKPAEKKNISWKKYLPVILSAVLFAVLLVIFLAFLRKKDKEKKSNKMMFIVVPSLLFVLAAIITALSTYMYFRLRDFNNSLAYIEMAEESLEKAANYLTYEARAKKLATICGFVAAGFAVLIPVGVLVRKMLIKGVSFKRKAKEGDGKERKAKKEKNKPAESSEKEE